MIATSEGVMCTNIISNRNKTLVGWNLDLLDMEYRVRPNDLGVFIEIKDKREGWMPIFGANKRGDFVGMPACWPYDDRSEPIDGRTDIIHLDIDLLMMKKSLDEIRDIAESGAVSSIPGVTFMGALSDKDGNLLHIVPGQGATYYVRPQYKVMTNFSPFKMDSEKHPWMGWDRYQTANALLATQTDDFDVSDMFEVLKAASQTVCPTVVSMVFDVTDNRVYWCENRNWDDVRNVQL